MNTELKEKTLESLKAREGHIVLKESQHGDNVAFIFSHDVGDGKRFYGYAIPRENGVSWSRLPSESVFMKTEREIVLMLHKEVIKLFRTEAKEEGAAVEERLLQKKEMVKSKNK